MSRGVKGFQVTNAIYIYVMVTLVLRSMVSIGTVDARNRS